MESGPEHPICTTAQYQRSHNLLKTTENRPQAFYRGDDTYDPFNLGFHSHVPTMENPPLQRPLSNGRMLILMDTQLRGNGNSGHEYGTELSNDEKDALLEYLKTL